MDKVWTPLVSDTADALSSSLMLIPAPSNAERKPQMNGHASPSHLAANFSNNHAGKQSKSHYLINIIVILLFL